MTFGSAIRPCRLLALIFMGLISTSALNVHAEDDRFTSIKNVLFVVSDDLKASVLGCYGNTVCKTPNLDRLAKRGLVFNRAYCQGTWCAPSRKSFMFSRYQDTAGISLGEHFKNQGIYTARVGKIFHMRVPGDIIDGTDGNDVPESWTERFNSRGREAHTPGSYACLNKNIFTDELDGRESTGMPNRMFVSVSYSGNGSDQPDYKTADKTIELLRKHKDQPFLIAAGLVRPHYPMVAPEQYFSPYTWQQIVLPKQIKDDLLDIPKLGIPRSTSSRNGLDQFVDNQRRMWSAYYAAVSFMDDQVGRILDELERLGLSENTAVVFLSDHGYHLGEHSFWQKNDLHEEVTRVPLIISVPGIKPGKSESIVELVDLYPTLAEVLGLEIPRHVQGTSLVPILRDSTATTKTGALSLIGKKGIAMRTARYAYMRYRDGSEEFYDMKQDIGQFTNLVGQKAMADAIETQRNELNARLRATGIADFKIKTGQPKD